MWLEIRTFKTIVFKNSYVEDINADQLRKNRFRELSSPNMIPVLI